MQITALQTARAGSKSIPKKNLLEINGDPLFAHSIKAATNCSLINSVWCSTDDEVIKELQKKLNKLNKDELKDTYWEIETGNYLNGNQINELEEEKDQMIRKLDNKNNKFKDNEVYEIIISFCKKYEELCIKKYPEAPLPLEILKSFN